MNKVGVVHITKATGVCGSENHLLTLLPKLDKKKYDLSLILLVEENKLLEDYARQFEIAGIPVEKIIIKYDLDPLLVLKLYRLLQRLDCQILHTHLIHADLYGTSAGVLKRAPIIVSTKHNDNLFRNSWFYAFLDRMAARFSDQTIVISEALRKFFVEIEKIDPSMIKRIYYGLDLPGPVEAQHSKNKCFIREEFQIASKAPLIGIVGRLILQKGHVFLLDAFAKLLQTFSDARLLVVGDGYLREELHAKTISLGISGSVIFTGFRNDIPAIMNSIDILVQPSLWEGFGLVLLEAMSANTPIVATRVSAIPEIVVDGETGLLVAPGNVDGLVDAISKLFGNPKWAAEMGRHGKIRLEKCFSVDRMVSQTEALYDALITQKLEN